MRRGPHRVPLPGRVMDKVSRLATFPIFLSKPPIGLAGKNMVEFFWTVMMLRILDSWPKQEKTCQKRGATDRPMRTQW